MRELHLQLCPSCAGDGATQPGGCATCESSGLLDSTGAPFHAPPPFDRWTPGQLVKLDEASRERRLQLSTRRLSRDVEEWTLTRDEHDQPAATHTARRLTLSDIVELLLTALARHSGDHSGVKLSRNARGETQIEVSVRTGDPGIETVEQARMRAEEQYEHLRSLYPLAGPQE